MLSPDVLGRLQSLHPAIASQLEEIVRLAPESADLQLLDLCSSYVDAALQQQDWTPPGGEMTEKESAFIAFTEQFVSSVSTMSDEQVSRLQEYASADEIYAFVNALYVADMVRRLNLVTQRVLQ